MTDREQMMLDALHGHGSDSKWIECCSDFMDVVQTSMLGNGVEHGEFVHTACDLFNLSVPNVVSRILDESPWTVEHTPAVLGILMTAHCLLERDSQNGDASMRWAIMAAYCLNCINVYRIHRRVQIPDVLQRLLPTSQEWPLTRPDERNLQILTMLLQVGEGPAHFRIVMEQLDGKHFLAGKSPSVDHQISAPLIVRDPDTGHPKAFRLHAALLRNGTGSIVYPNQFLTLTYSSLQILVHITESIHGGNYANLISSDRDLAIWLDDVDDLTVFNRIRRDHIQASIHFPVHCLLHNEMPYREDTALCFTFDLKTKHISPWRELDLIGCFGSRNSLPVYIKRVIAAPPANSTIASLIALFSPTPQRPDIRFAESFDHIVDLLTRPALLTDGPNARGNDIEAIKELAAKRHWITVFGDRGLGKSFVAKHVMQQWPEGRRFIIDCRAVRSTPLKRAVDLCRAVSAELLGRQSDTTMNLVAEVASEEFVLLIDNFDAIPVENRPSVTALISDLSAELKGERQVILVTADGLLTGPGETEYQLKALSHDAVEKIVRWHTAAYFPNETGMSQQQETLWQLYERLRFQPTRIPEVIKDLADGHIVDLLQYVRNIITPTETIYNELNSQEPLAARAILLLSLFPTGIDLVRLAAIDHDTDYRACLPILVNREYADHEAAVHGRLAPGTHLSTSDYYEEAVHLLDPNEREEIEIAVEKLYIAFLREHVARIGGPDTNEINQTIQAERTNIEAAMNRAVLQKQFPLLLQMITNMTRFYWWQSDKAGIAWVRRGIMAAMYLLRQSDSRDSAVLIDAATCHFLLGDIYRRASKYRGARRYYLYAEELFRVAGDDLGIARSLRGRADCFRRQDEYSAAIRHYSDAKAGLTQMVQGNEGEKPLSAHTLRGYELELADVLKGTASALRKQVIAPDEEYGTFAQARKLYDEALGYYERFDDLLGKANCLREIGDMLLLQADYDSAFNELNTAKSYYKILGQSSLGEAHCLRALGELAWWRDQIPEAGQYFSEAEGIYRLRQDVLGQARCLFVRGQLDRIEGNEKRKKGRRQEAEECYQRAIQKFNGAERVYTELWIPSWIANCFRAKADVYREQEMFSVAEAMYGMAKSAYQDRQILHGVALCLRGLGEVYLGQLLTKEYSDIEPPSDVTGRLAQQAIWHFQRARRIAHRSGICHLETHCVRGIAIARGRLAKQSGRASWLSKAKKYLETCRQFYIRVEDRAGIERVQSAIEEMNRT